MLANPELTEDWRIHFEARGNLIEPHTGRKIPLGTAEIEDYQALWTNGELAFPDKLDPWDPQTCGPHNRFAAVFVCEKEGFNEIFEEVGLGKKYDLAINRQ